MISSMIKAALAIALFSITACGDNGDGPIDTQREECNPLGGPACMMPWPSSAYLIEDSSTVSGYRVDVPAAAMPVNADSIAIESDVYNTYDGFAVAGPMLVDFPTGVSVDGLPPLSDIAKSLEASSSIVVVDMDTGERLPFFAEPDMNAAAPEERALIIRPMVRMAPATRYAVGIRNTVKAADGSALPVPEGFAAILEGKEIKHPLFARMGNYEDIFSSLADAGLPKSELVLAWDFVTASDESLTGDLMAMRTQALAKLDEVTLGFTLNPINNNNTDNVLRIFEGTYDTPMFLDNGERDNSILIRDEDGVPAFKEMDESNIAVVIPKCVETAELPIPVVIFGHGMFGNAADSLDSAFIQRFANEECTILVGSDFIGLTNRQFASVAFAMNELNKGKTLTEKMAQSIINFIALGRALRTTMLDAEEFKLDGVQIIDPEAISYFGASLGGILGGVFMAYDPTITRGALGVPGGPWSLLFERSVFWPPLRITMKGAYPEPWDYQQNVALMGMLFEKVDPVTTAHRVIANPLPGTPPKQLLLYMALGDALVTQTASDTLARSLDLPVIGPSVSVPFGLEETTEIVSSGYTVYDEAPDRVPPESNAMEDLEFNSTHGDVHEWSAVQRQVFGFLKDGMISSECFLESVPAPCLCPTGACE